MKFSTYFPINHQHQEQGNVATHDALSASNGSQNARARPSWNEIKHTGRSWFMRLTPTSKQQWLLPTVKTLKRNTCNRSGLQSWALLLYNSGLSVCWTCCRCKTHVRGLPWDTDLNRRYQYTLWPKIALQPTCLGEPGFGNQAQTRWTWLEIILLLRPGAGNWASAL